MRDDHFFLQGAMRTFFPAVLSLLLLCLTPAPATTQSSGDYERGRLLQVASEIIEDAGYAALATVDDQNRPRIRVMDPFPPEEGMVIWFATNPRTRKVEEIRGNPSVAVYYFDPEAMGYVTISGTARLVDDPREKALRWKEEWEAFYPDREEAYLLIEVTPRWMEVVSVGHGVTGPDEDWRPPRVEFGGG